MQVNKYQTKQSGFTLIEVMVVIVILGVLAALIVPNVMGRGEKAKVDTTVITLKASAFIRVAWPFLVIATVVAIVFLLRFLKSTAGHYAFDRLTLKLPLFGKLSRGINSARLASTLSILTKSGVPLVDALRIGAAVSSNWVIRDSVDLAAEKVTA